MRGCVRNKRLKSMVGKKAGYWKRVSKFQNSLKILSDLFFLSDIWLSAFSVAQKCLTI